MGSHRVGDTASLIRLTPARDAAVHQLAHLFERCGIGSRHPDDERRRHFASDVAGDCRVESGL